MRALRSLVFVQNILLCKAIRTYKRRVAANTLGKQLRITDKWWPSSLEVEREN